MASGAESLPALLVFHPYELLLARYQVPGIKEHVAFCFAQSLLRSEQVRHELLIEYRESWIVVIGHRQREKAVVVHIGESVGNWCPCSSQCRKERSGLLEIRRDRVNLVGHRKKLERNRA